MEENTRFNAAVAKGVMDVRCGHAAKLEHSTPRHIRLPIGI